MKRPVNLLLSFLTFVSITAQIPETGDPLANHAAWGYDRTEETTPNNRKAYVIQRHNGLSLSAHSYYGGIRFYNQESPSPYGYNGDMVMSITGGKVGIGTISPGAKLDVNGSSIFRGDINLGNYDLSWSNTQIDLDAGPRTKLSPMSIRLWDHYSYPNSPPGLYSYGTVMEIYGRSSHQTSQLFFGADGIIRYRNARYNSSWGNWVKLLDSQHDIESTGNMKIGGKITAQEVEVKLDVFPDFVFEPTYPLISLEDLEKYIKQNKHLPDVPSAEEVKENGLSLGQSDAILLQKIEELTLYVIEQNKRLNKVEAENEELKKAEAKAKAEVGELKKLNAKLLQLENEIKELKNKN